MLDRRTALCLACSSSLPPNVDDSELFVTKCCGRPICPRCLEKNPRLARYDPCLACLAGVGVIRASSSAGSRPGARSVRAENLDGAVRDQDLFVLADGDEDEDDEDDDSSVDGEEGGQVYRSAAPPPPDMIPTVSPLLKTPPPPPPVTDDTEEAATDITPAPPTLNEDSQSAKQDAPVVYRLRRGDTLMGIALRFRLDAMELCRLNNLPTTTLSTTPNILHTRTTILLSPVSKPTPEDPALVEARRVERAERRLQMVTKEVDWRVAKAYVAIAQDSGPSGVSGKEKPDNYEGRLKVPVSDSEGSSQKGALESGAIDRYLDDTEWEEEERKEGRGPAIQRFPWGSFGQKSGQSPGTHQGSGGFKWPWSA